jgi:predicted flap endonuclease-1-like 5' DNA nuclease
MPDGAVPSSVPSSVDVIAAALDAARASLEEHLSLHPDWAAYQAAGRAPYGDAAHLTARLETTPAFKAFRQLRTAVSLLPMRDAGFQLATTDQRMSRMTVRAAVTADQSVLTAERPTDPTRDDLTRIRGIDSVLARRLSAIGIARFAQVAAWEHEDVRTIAQALGLGREFVRYGIIEQANWLDAERLAKLALQQTPATVSASKPRLTSVAVWTPRTGPAAPPVVKPDLSLTAVQPSLVTALQRVRAGCAMNRIVALATLVPELDQPVFVAVDIDATIEVPEWRCVPLAPFGESPTAADPVSPKQVMPVARLTDQLDVSVSAPLKTVSAAADVPTSEPVPPPLHEVAGRRLADLEAELDALALTWHPVPAAVTAATERPMAEKPVVLAILAEPHHPVDHAALSNVDEADVRIVAVSRPRVSPLAPLPDLPLTARRTVDRQRPGGATLEIAAEGGMLGFADVEEAAVVIVSRASPQSAVADLPFYTRSQPEAPPLPARRFLQALLGA